MTSRLDVVPGVAMPSIPPSEVGALAEVLVMVNRYCDEEDIEGNKKTDKEATHYIYFRSRPALGGLVTRLLNRQSSKRSITKERRQGTPQLTARNESFQGFLMEPRPRRALQHCGPWKSW
jgi:hypothetical protein